MKYVDEPSKFLHDSGLLFEINRLLLHPLGLALEVELESASIKIQDLREDPEGMLFEEEAFARARSRYQAFLDENRSRLEARERALSFRVQERP